MAQARERLGGDMHYEGDDCMPHAHVLSEAELVEDRRRAEQKTNLMTHFFGDDCEPDGHLYGRTLESVVGGEHARGHFADYIESMPRAAVGDYLHCAAGCESTMEETLFEADVCGDGPCGCPTKDDVCEAGVLLESVLRSKGELVEENKALEARLGLLQKGLKAEYEVGKMMADEVADGERVRKALAAATALCEESEHLLVEGQHREEDLRRELNEAKEKLAVAREVIKQERAGHDMSQFFNEVYEAKGKRLEDAYGKIERTEERGGDWVIERFEGLDGELSVYKRLFEAERSVSDALLDRVNELRGNGYSPPKKERWAYDWGS